MAAATSSGIVSLPNQRLAGKVALVTGVATGIGESIVCVFHQHGAKVCIVDINDEAGQRVSGLLRGDPNIVFFHCDVTKEDEVSQAVDFTVSKFRSLDIIVNNAGICGPRKDIRDTNMSDFDKVFDINVRGVFLGMKHASQTMIPANKGSIINICSVAGCVAGLAPHSYTASKHAVLGLTKSVAAELGQYGIRVNCVSPYAVATNMGLVHLAVDERTDDAMADFRAFTSRNANMQGIELKREDVANAVLFLASDESRYISGDNLMVDVVLLLLITVSKFSDDGLVCFNCLVLETLGNNSLSFSRSVYIILALDPVSMECTGLLLLFVLKADK